MFESFRDKKEDNRIIEDLRNQIKELERFDSILGENDGKILIE